MKLWLSHARPMLQWSHTISVTINKKLHYQIWWNQPDHIVFLSDRSTNGQRAYSFPCAANCTFERLLTPIWTKMAFKSALLVQEQANIDVCTSRSSQAEWKTVKRILTRTTPPDTQCLTKKGRSCYTVRKLLQRRTNAVNLNIQPLSRLVPWYALCGWEHKEAHRASVSSLCSGGLRRERTASKSDLFARRCK